MGKWTAILILAAAQFVMVLDSSVMNVSISQVVADLDTTITGVQLAITAYTLVMAAFMLVGAKLGDILGRDRAFAVGLAVYATGSGITAISPSLPVLLFGAAITTQVAETGLQIVPVEQAEQLLIEAGIPPADAAAIAADYGAAELDGLRNALLGVALFALLAFWFTRRLPGVPLHAETAEALPAPA